MSWVWAQAVLPAGAPNENAPYTDEGPDRCVLCHSGLRMEFISETPHGDRENPDTPFGQHGCESCHGPGGTHVSQSRRSKGRSPMITFGPNASTSLDIQIEACATCHRAQREELLKIPGHANALVAKEDGMEWLSCSSCHTIHQIPERLQDEDVRESAALTERLDIEPHYIENGSEHCLLCHSEPRQQLMSQTVHGDTANPNAPYGQRGCESCHGMGSLHVTENLRGQNRPPMISFGADAKTPVQTQVQTCLGCHRNNMEQLMNVPAHRRHDNIDNLACSTCHTLHPFPDSFTPAARIRTPIRGRIMPAPPSSTAQYTEDGADHCLICHSDERMELIEGTPHGDRSNPHAPFAQHECESCHGRGSIHVSQSRRGQGRAPMIAFGEDAHSSVESQTQTCLSCHKKVHDGFPDLSWDAMVHNKESTTCAACHQVHIDDSERNSSDNQINVCLNCHDQAGHDAPAIGWHGSFHANDDVTCSSCHRLHMAGSLLDDTHTQTATCEACHSKGAGHLDAILWHDSVHALEELDCSDCHAVHAQANPILDRRVQAEKCYSCHEDAQSRHPQFSGKFIDFDRLTCWTCHDVHQLIPTRAAGEAAHQPDDQKPVADN